MNINVTLDERQYKFIIAAILSQHTKNLKEMEEMIQNGETIEEDLLGSGKRLKEQDLEKYRMLEKDNYLASVLIDKLNLARYDSNRC